MPRGWLRLAAWLLIVSPILPLFFIMQANNVYLPHSNLLFLPLAMCVSSGVLVGWIQGKLMGRSGLLAGGILGAFLLGWTVTGWVQYQQLVTQSRRVLFEASPTVARGVAWLIQHKTPNRVVFSTFSGAVVPGLADVPRQPWVSRWEWPALVASPTGAGRDLYRPEALILITHIDADERPETVRWMMQDPHFKLVKQIEGTDPDVTLAFLRLVALDSSQVGGGSGRGEDSQ